MNKINDKVKNLILRYINCNYKVLNNYIFCNTDYKISPNKMSQSISLAFDISLNSSDQIIMTWLINNDYQNIIVNWYRVPEEYDYKPSWFQTIESGTYTYTTNNSNYIMGVDAAITIDQHIVLTTQA